MPRPEPSAVPRPRRRRHARRQGLGHGSRQPRSERDLQHRRGDKPNTAPTAVADTGDATEKGGVANGSGGLPASGNVLTNDTDPDAGDTKTVTAVSFGTTAGTLGTALAGAHGSLVLNASGAFTYTVNETDSAVQALRLSTNTITDIFNYTMRDTAGATSSTTLTVTIHGANDAPVLGFANPRPECGGRFGLLAGAARRNLHRRRCWRHPRLHRNFGQRHCAALVAHL